MRMLKNKVAVVTGASSGIGKCIAFRAASEGMRIVLAGINESNLAEVEARLRSGGSTVISVRTDVSKKADVDALARKTVETFGTVHILFNNAGITGGSILKTELADWEWIMGVNLWSVIYGVQAFVPLMQAQGDECHIVNTASIAGINATAELGAYCVTKYGVVALSEALYHELGEMRSRIKVSVVCPSYVRTRILDSIRNRPRPTAGASAPRPSEKEMDAEWDRLGAKWHSQILAPEAVADKIFDAINEEKLYVLTHPESKLWTRNHMEDIIEERNPQIDLS